MEIQKAKELRDQLQEDRLRWNLGSEGFCGISWAEFKFLGGNAIQVLDFIAVSV